MTVIHLQRASRIDPGAPCGVCGEAHAFWNVPRGGGGLYALNLSPALQVLYSTHLFSTSRVTRCPCGVRASELREALHARPAVPAPVTWDAALSKTTPRIRGTTAHVFCVSILNVTVRDRRLYGTSQRARALGKIGFAGCWRSSGWVLDGVKSAEDAGARGCRLRVGKGRSVLREWHRRVVTGTRTTVIDDG